MDDFRTWHWLETVIELGGLKPASERLHRTPSTISHAIKQLERRIGVTLVETRARRIRLTEAGSILLEHMRPLIRELEGVQGVIDQFRATGASVLRLAVDQVFPHEQLIKAMERFSQDYPHTRLELFETVLGGGPAMFREGEVGIYLGLEPVGDHTGVQLGRVRFVPCAGPRHPLVEQAESKSSGQLLADGQLRQYRQIVLRDSHPERGANAGWLGAAQRVTVDHMHTAVELMRSGLGFGWLPEHQVRDEPDLRVLPVNEGLCPEAAVMLYRQRDLQASPAHQCMMEAFVEACRDD
ncbi:LysR family transcriptional regulator [Guyparkeria hydrothermalis]|uniref:LysR family transcriptional regulator n=1 Tax=Guyparkeria hydrothermalis TaxID=923 RepID=UPI002020B1E5|nr:LysR family transcriptional regulator [Guyparkeria hydrothermalis]MCL7743877.1 LysR family transcriptional regulator [Guyparkeria hydrothermalis]